MSKLRVQNHSLVIPTRRAKLASALRVAVNTAAVVAVALYFAGADNIVALATGLALAPLAALRSRRISIRFAGNALAADNYFRSYRVLELDGAIAHEYMRGRLELELGDGARVYLQGANMQSRDEREDLLSELTLRGAKIPTVNTAQA